MSIKRKLRDEKDALTEEIESIREYFGDEVYYDEDDLEYEELLMWGDMLRAERRVREITEELQRLGPR